MAERAKVGAKTVEEAYNILGIPQNAPQCDVKQAYKKMALRYHPDKNPGNAEAHKQFILISEAFQRISRSRHSHYNKQKYQDHKRSDNHNSYSVNDDDDDDEGSDDGSDYDEDDDEYYDDDDDDDEGSDDDMFSGRGDTMFEEMFRRMFFEGRGIRGRGGPSFSFNFGRRCDCPECRNQFRPKTPKMSEQEIAQARQDRKERNMRTKAQREAEAESARLEKERIEREKREKIAEEKEAAVQRIAERKNVPDEVNKVVEALKENLANLKADKYNVEASNALSGSVSAGQTLLMEKTSDGSNLVTVNIGRDKLNTSLKKATAFLSALAREEEEERERENAVNIERENKEREELERKEREEAEQKEKELRDKEERERQKEEIERKKTVKAEEDVNTKSDTTSKQPTDARKEKEKPLSKKAQKKLDMLNAAKSTAAAAAQMKSVVQAPSPPQTVKTNPTVMPAKTTNLPGSVAAAGQKGGSLKFSPAPMNVPSGKGGPYANTGKTSIQEVQKVMPQQKFTNKPISKTDITSSARESSYELTVNNLIAMGFEMKDSKEAVNKYGNNFDAAVTFLLQKKSSKREIPPYQQQQSMPSGYNKPPVPGTSGSTGGSMYNSKLGQGKVNAPGFGKSTTLPTPPMPPAAGVGSVSPLVPPQQPLGSGVASDKLVKPANFFENQSSSPPNSSQQQLPSAQTLGGLGNALHSDDPMKSSSLPPGLQSLSTANSRGAPSSNNPNGGDMYSSNMWRSQVLPNHQSLSSNVDMKHGIQSSLADPTNDYSPFSSSLQPSLLNPSMGGLNNGGLGGLGIDVNTDQGSIPLGGITSGLGGGLSVNQGFDNSFNLRSSGSGAFGLLETPNTSSETPNKLPNLDDLGGLFSNTGDGNLNENGSRNGQQPQWQLQNAPGMDVQQSNLNGIGVNMNNDQPAWW